MTSKRGTTTTKGQGDKPANPQATELVSGEGGKAPTTVAEGKQLSQCTVDLHSH